MRKYIGKTAAFLLVFTLAALVGAAPTTGPSSGTGSIKGTVMNDGKPLANATVRLMQRANNDANTPNATTPPTTQNGKRRHPDRPARGAVVATTQTDAEGNFTFANLASGTYVVIARDRATRVGGASEISVSDAQASSVSITAKQHKPKNKN